MPARSIAVFFYGLFMDVGLLHEKGVHPKAVRQACVQGFSIRIGHRATLVPDPEGRVYGMLMELSHGEIEGLYAEPSLQMYRPEAMLCQIQDATSVAALCFILPQDPAASEHNQDYARQLRDLGRTLGLPPGYVETIR